MSTNANNDQSQNPLQTGTSSKPFSAWRVIKLATIPLVLFVLIATGISLGWEDALKQWIRPQLVPVTGEVRYEGKPMTVGFVSTRYLDGQGGTTLGPLDSEGRFSLSTNGVPGAFVGQHKVLVLCFDGSVFPPRSIIPEKYAQEAATPLMIKVTSSKEKNHFLFKIDDQ
jgi:hypothetical protein